MGLYPHILFVENDDIKHMIVKLNLARLGVEVVRAVSLTDAQEKLDGQDFDLIIMDGEVPGDVSETVAFVRLLLARRPEQIILANSRGHNHKLLDAGCLEELVLPNPTLQIKRLLRIPDATG